MNNITELRNELTGVFKDVRAGTIDAEKAQALNNTAGKIIKSLAVELAYFEQIKQTPSIAFFSGPSGLVGSAQQQLPGAASSQ